MVTLHNVALSWLSVFTQSGTAAQGMVPLTFRMALPSSVRFVSMAILSPDILTFKINYQVCQGINYMIIN